jgi:hypothetical protein
VSKLIQTDPRFVLKVPLQPGMVVHLGMVTPAILEVEVRGSQSKNCLGKSTRPYLKNKLKQKDLEV